ncbi:ATP-dependent DNA helicase RecG [Limnohabitans sp.]|uniref:ATP-dependent DNA helicase RecG n=1 Tax=Limnohabitans sp. TaxID=1907725 RepID=UPI00286EE6E5|nr:ATP-dependent DNA helicase RecG [Limnohabitans sp.]
MPAAKPTVTVKTDNKPLSAPQKALRKLGLDRDIDLALHLPLRYEDETRIVRLADTREGDMVQIEATVVSCDITYKPRRQLLVEVDDGSDTCTLRFFSFYPSQQKALAVGNRLRLRGEIKGGFMGRTMMHPSFHAAGGELPQALTPVYPTSAGLPQVYLRKAVHGGLVHAARHGAFTETIPQESMPPSTLRYGKGRDANSGSVDAWGLAQSLHFLHHPTPDVSLAQLEDRTHPAWQRLKAEELLAQQLSQLQSKRARDLLRAPALRLRAGGLHEQLLAVLPFALTGAQRRVGEELAQDLMRQVPMHRLLQGDVGSGKTVVAALAAAVAMDGGWQCALMAPTEILAEQHFRKLIGWLEPLLSPLGKRVAWLTGSQKKKERTEMLGFIASGEAALVVGTHAVIQEQVKFKNLALAIIDEQHRFGVAQRLALRDKMKSTEASDADGRDAAVSAPQQEPHMLMMSATPIPRTLAMSYYADLDVSTLDELPPGRTPIVTRLVSESRRDELIERIRHQIDQGRQVYWVCPLIEESEAIDLTNATETHALLTEALNPPGRAPVLVGLLHSRMPAADKKAEMAKFESGQMAVLVSTTVIEVGVDVPNASLMVIEHAERFGLSQLHQLRGRVGRGAAASACVLMYATGDSGRLSETARERLKAMVETTDGFEIARRDLEIRGPGEFLGARQSGAALLRFADLAEDVELLEWARELAPKMLDQYPRQAEQHVARWLGGKSDFLKA